MGFLTPCHFCIAPTAAVAMVSRDRPMEFPTTHWSQLADATLHGDSAARAALGGFYERYRRPVAQFIAARGVAVAQVEDLTQDFFVHLMQHSLVRRADASRGRFRSFLLGALVRFLADAADRERALKRGGGAAVVSLDALETAGVAVAEAGPASEAVALAAFDYDWAVEILGHALDRLEADYVRQGRGAEFAVLRAYVPGGIEPPAYEVAATHLGIGVAAFKTHVHRLRERFRGCLRAELAATVSSPDEIDAELAYLGRVLQSRAMASLRKSA